MKKKAAWIPYRKNLYRFSLIGSSPFGGDIVDREKIKYIPFGACEYEYMEAWLEDLAREGWLLQSMFACFATFRESEPKQLRYRIVPNAAFQADEEEISFYEENGWHFVGCSRGLNVFCCEDPRVPELFTDLQSFSRRVRNYAIASGICVLSFGYLIWRNSMNGYGIFRQYGGFLHAIHELGIITFPAISFLILLAIAVSVRCAVKYARHAKRIACRQKIERKHNFRRVAAINVAWISAAMLCTTALGVGLIKFLFF